MFPSQRTQKSGPLDPAPLGVRVMRTVQLGSGSNTNIPHFQGPHGETCGVASGVGRGSSYYKTSICAWEERNHTLSESHAEPQRHCGIKGLLSWSPVKDPMPFALFVGFLSTGCRLQYYKVIARTWRAREERPRAQGLFCLTFSGATVVMCA